MRKRAFGATTVQLNAGFQPSFVKVSPGQPAPQNEAIPLVVCIVTFPPSS